MSLDSTLKIFGWDGRTGLKLALAGCLALFFSLLMRLDEPSWAVTTAFVLSTPRFVGAIVEKTVFRIFGAIGGAVLGYVITGSLEQWPVLFLGAMGGLVTVTTALFGGTLAPYFFRQLGYTATLVAAQGMMDPAFSWQVGLARCEEILLGIGVATTVQVVLWPRYATEEFEAGVRRTLRALHTVLAEQKLDFFGRPTQVSVSTLLPGVSSLGKLRKMIRLGAFESRGFAANSPAIEEIVARLGSLSVAIAEFGHSLSPDSPFRNYLEIPTRQLHQTYLEALQELSADGPESLSDEAAFHHRLLEAWRTYGRALARFRIDGTGSQLTLDESLDHAAFFRAAERIAHDLAELHTLLCSFAEDRRASFPTIKLARFTMPSRAWWQSGLRAGITLVVGMLFVNYAKPPGGDLLIVGAYLFGAFTLESSDKDADLGVFNWLAQTILLCLAFFFFLLLAAPLLASYAVMNVVMGGILFATGYCLNAGKWNSNQVLLSLLFIVGLLKIDAQHPVAFQDIVGATFGVALSAVLAAFSRRLLWPVLPQFQLRDRLLALLRFVRDTASSPLLAVPRQRLEFVLGVAQAHELISNLSPKYLKPKETLLLQNYLTALLRGGAPALVAAATPFTERSEWPRETLEAFEKPVSEVLHGEALRLRGEPAGESHCREYFRFSGWSKDFTERAEKARQEIKAAHWSVPTTVQSLAQLHGWRERCTAAAELAHLGCPADFKAIFTDRQL